MTSKTKATVIGALTVVGFIIGMVHGRHEAATRAALQEEQAQQEQAAEFGNELIAGAIAAKAYENQQNRAAVERVEQRQELREDIGAAMGTGYRRPINNALEYRSPQ